MSAHDCPVAARFDNVRSPRLRWLPAAKCSGLPAESYSTSPYLPSDVSNCWTRTAPSAETSYCPSPIRLFDVSLIPSRGSAAQEMKDGARPLRPWLRAKDAAVDSEPPL